MPGGGSNRLMESMNPAGAEPDPACSAAAGWQNNHAESAQTEYPQKARTKRQRRHGGVKKRFGRVTGNRRLSTEDAWIATANLEQAEQSSRRIQALKKKVKVTIMIVRGHRPTRQFGFIAKISILWTIGIVFSLIGLALMPMAARRAREPADAGTTTDLRTTVPRRHNPPTRGRPMSLKETIMRFVRITGIRLVGRGVIAVWAARIFQ